MTEIKQTVLELSDDIEPVAINNIDVIDVMAATDPEKNRGAKTWYIKYGDVDYPLKWVVARAAENSCDHSVDSRQFHTDYAKKVATELGFEVKER
jgi:transcription initiation factor IIE alpha subunit